MPPAVSPSTPITNPTAAEPGRADAPASVITRVAERVSRALEAAFTVDVRALAAFRIAVGLLLLTDLWIRAGDLAAHYTDAGVLPRAALLAKAGPVVLSLHLLNGSLLFQAGLFLLAAMLAVGLVAGYRARLVASLSWVMLLSLHARNPFVLDSGDTILLILLFWGSFLPLGARWSVDALRRGRPTESSVFSIATLGLLLQICAVYWFSVGYKNGIAWRQTYTAVYDVLQLDAFATPLGLWMRTLPPEVLAWGTWSTLQLEAWAPLLALLPFFRGRLRVAGALAMIGFHAGLGSAISLGTFPFICMAAWLLFLPSRFWDWTSGHVPARDRLMGWLRSCFNVQPGSGKPIRMELSATTSTLLALVLVYVSLLHGAALYPNGAFGRVTRALGGLTFERPAHVVRYGFRWNMFSPVPPSVDGWYVMEGVLQDGERVNLFDEGAALPWEKPRVVSAQYVNQRWRKYLYDHYRAVGFQDRRAHFAAHLHQRWASRHPDQPLEQVNVYFMQEGIPIDGETPEAERQLVFTQPVQLADAAGGP